MNDQDLTSGLKDFFAQDDDQSGKGAKTIGGIGMWVLHLVVLAFAIYSAYHGISATSRYHADNGLGMLAGIIGIIVIEVVLLGLYISFFARRVTGTAQQIAAAATALLGFTLSCLGIVGDSQMQAGLATSGWLSAYLAWGLPIAPAFMALGAAIVMGLEPKHLRLMSKSVKEEEFEETRHKAVMAKLTAELNFARGLANMQLNSQEDAARYLMAARRSPQVQDAINRSALASMPELLRAIGVDLPHGTIIEGEAIPMPPPAAESNPGGVERLFGNRAAVEDHDEPLNDESMMTFIQRQIAEGKIVIPLANSKPNGAPPPVVGGSANGVHP